ncbi:MAG: hypothetical protein WBD24_00635 [Candidatus Omnitrophota bacterium]
MKRRKYIQSCEVGSMYGKKKNQRKTAAHSAKVRKKDLTDVYNKFFKDQVAALYKAINSI